MVRVTLEPWEYEWAYRVGIGRFTSNWNKTDAAHYQQGGKEEDRKASPAAAMCELAVAKFLNQYWSGSCWCKADHNKYSHLPDVGKNVEVRRIRTRNGPAIRRGDLGRIVYGCRLVDGEYRSVEVVGYYSVPPTLESLLSDSRLTLVRVPDHPEKDYFICPTQCLTSVERGD